MERSLAFTALLEFEAYRTMESRKGSQAVTDMLADYHASGGYQANGTLYDYALVWWPASTYAA